VRWQNGLRNGSFSCMDDSNILGEILVAVPLTAMFTIDCIPFSVTKFIELNLDLWIDHHVPTPGIPDAHLKRSGEKCGVASESLRRDSEGMPALWPNVGGPTLKFRDHYYHPHPAIFSSSISEFHAKPEEQEYESNTSNLLAQRESRGMSWLSSQTLTRRRFPITGSL
jgi:hypothetical protein